MKISAPVMLDIQGLSLTPDENKILKHPKVGGVILFTRNYESPDQLRNLIAEIRGASHARLFIAVDQEGGRVQRFRKGFTELPSLGSLGEIYETNPEEAILLTEKSGEQMAKELRAFDIDFSFAPVLDLRKNISEVIGDRSFHRDPAVVSILAKAYITGMHRAGMIAVGKHFPGHGSVAADSHIALPVDTRTFEEIEKEDLIPFQDLIHHGLDAVMPAHVIYSAVDKNPAGFSAHWLKKVLRDQLNFKGIIFSDDLSMEGAAVVNDIKVRARLALDAGCDMILICNDSLGASQVLSYL
jgi:beta-N-acetylhexosaminidase